MRASTLRRLLAEPGVCPYFVVEVDYDQDAENPNDEGDWKLVSFNPRHVNHEPHEKHFDGLRPRPGLARKLKAGTAFLLDYFEHGMCRWSLHGEGPRCRWDTATQAGLLLWTQPARNLGPKTYEERAEDARSYLERYTAWCNGECYQYTVYDWDGERLEGCSGFYDADSLAESIEEDVGGFEVVLKGSLAEMVSGLLDNEVGEEDVVEED